MIGVAEAIVAAALILTFGPVVIYLLIVGVLLLLVKLEELYLRWSA